MSLRTPEQYLKGLRDDRAVYYRGERVPDVTEHLDLGLAARHASIDFMLPKDPRHRDLAVVTEAGEAYSSYYRIPRSADDLLARSRLIELGTTEGGTLVLLIKEIGTDALFALMRILAAAGERDGEERVRAFHRRCRNEDAALAVAQTDVKGDRSRHPHAQDDPDLYLRVVDRSDEGIVVRGAKVHTSCAPYVDHLIVLPSRTMGPEDEAWSVAFTVPVATAGVRLYAADFLGGTEDPFTQPISSAHRMIETLTVFDDVFVPWDQVFFALRPDLAGPAALTFVEFHRFTAVSYKLPLLDALVGASVAVAEANGIQGAGHVRDKLTWLIGYAETVRALTHLAAVRARKDGAIVHPDVLTTNLAKWSFARDFHRALEVVQDLAGGLLVTGPSGADWESGEVRPVLEKYLRGAWPAGRRMAILNLIADLTSGPYGGYQAVLAIHAEGSIEPEKMALLRAYDPGRAVSLALRLAKLDAETES
ncbi:MAG: 4-hydroxyphenylacetate 3-hydroxylase N-terminal domain-containing protein [Actinomycetota bacterium]